MSATCNTELDHQVTTFHLDETVTPRLRVLLADDQKEMLQEIILILRHEFTVLGAAHDGEGAVELATRLHPDVLILDISMPGLSGIEVASRLKKAGSKIRIIFLTVHDDPEFAEAALSVGALGYVLKTSITADLVPAILAAVGDRVFISPAMQRQ